MNALSILNQLFVYFLIMRYLFRTGLVKKDFTDDDCISLHSLSDKAVSFDISFPVELDVNMKAVCLGACFLIGKSLKI